MYRVTKDGTRIIIVDWNGKTIYSAEEDAIVVYQTPNGIATAKVGSLTEEALLSALAKAVKIAL